MVFNLWGRHPKATRYYETNPQGHKQLIIVCVFHTLTSGEFSFILTEAISFRKLGMVHGVAHGWGPWTGSMGWSMDQVHPVVHGPRSMFCIRPLEASSLKIKANVSAVCKQTVDSVKRAH